jgi:hypothetical protein
MSKLLLVSPHVGVALKTWLDKNKAEVIQALRAHSEDDGGGTKA